MKHIDPINGTQIHPPKGGECTCTDVPLILRATRVQNYENVPLVPLVPCTDL